MALVGPIDNFNTGTAPGAAWTTFGAIAPSIVSGQLRLRSAAAGTDYAGVVAATSVNITGNEFFCKPTPSPLTGSHECILEYRRNDDSTGLQIAQSGSELYWGLATAMSAGRAYNATTDAWWRISESGGLIRFWVSPDGSTWNSLGTAPKPGWATSGRPQLAAGHWDTEGAATNALIDNFNTTGAGGGFPTGPTTLAWSGYTWDVRQDQTLQEPGPNLWARSTNNVRVEGSELVVAIVQNGPSGEWTSTEVDGPTSLGYGTYTYVVNSRLDNIDSYEVLGLFTWGDNPPSNNEIDIEAARWGEPTGPSGSTTVWQNFDTDTRDTTTFDFSANPPYTCQFRWEPGQVIYTITDATATTLHSRVVSTGVPTPANEIPIINYWRFENNPPSALKELRIASFAYSPLSTTTKIATVV